MLGELFEDIKDVIKLVKKKIRKTDYLGCLIYNKEFYIPNALKRRRKRKQNAKNDINKKGFCSAVKCIFKSLLCLNICTG